MTTREQLLFERFEALIEMIEQDGATAAGENPRTGDLSALLSTREIGHAEEVRRAHANSDTPPTFS